MAKMPKTVKLYQIRQWTQYMCSVGLSQKLRSRTRALRLVKRLHAKGVECFISPVYVVGFNSAGERI